MRGKAGPMGWPLRALVMGLALPLALPCGLEGQDERPWFVSGIVVGGVSQLPVEGAQVSLLGEDLAVLATTLSGVEGLWGLSGDELAAVVQVNVVAPGFLPWYSEGPVLRRGLRIELRREGDPLPRPPVDLSEDGILARCGARSTPESAILAGLVIDPESGQGFEGAEVIADWASAEPPRLVVGGEVRLSYRSSISDPDGFYLFCDLPPDRPLNLFLRGAIPVADSVEVTLEAGRVRTIDVVQAGDTPGASHHR